MVETVEATGTLQPVDTVEVGTQVTGTIVSLGADFNSRVSEGQVLATLDPALLQAEVDQAAATVTRLSAEVERAKVSLADSETKLRRAEALSREQLHPQADLDTAQIDPGRRCKPRSSRPRRRWFRRRASLNQTRVNLGAHDHPVTVSRRGAVDATSRSARP